MQCRDVMWSSPVTLAPEDTAHVAVRKITQADVGALPVVDDDGRYLGMVSERALVRQVMAEGLDPKLTRVGLIIDRRMPQVDPDDPVSVALKRMDEARTRWVAVVQDRKVIGLIGTRDIRQRARSEDASDLHVVTDAALLH
ncbi:cyclic nucleotide-binding/CBS domain-containing protein [Vulgatibacter sp.]|uniref:CBS domain-containing protein n=1 Tax=Vulgatibacter sp. TaxID=1971226 RepID=UPI0035625B0F